MGSYFRQVQEGLLSVFDWFEQHPVPHSNIVIVGSLALSISVAISSALLDTAVMLLSFVCVFLLARYAFAYWVVPTQKILTVGGGVLFGLGNLYVFMDISITTSLTYQLLYTAIPLSFIYESKHLTKLAEYYAFSDDDKRIIFVEGKTNLYVSPVYFALLFDYIPRKTKKKLFTSSGCTVIIMKKDSQLDNYAVQFESTEQFIEAISKPEESSIEQFCHLCESETTVSVPYDRLVFGSEAVFSGSANLCDTCREEIVDVAVENDIITREELLVTTI